MNLFKFIDMRFALQLLCRMPVFQIVLIFFSFCMRGESPDQAFCQIYKKKTYRN